MFAVCPSAPGQLQLPVVRISFVPLFYTARNVDFAHNLNGFYTCHPKQRNKLPDLYCWCSHYFAHELSIKLFHIIAFSEIQILNYIFSPCWALVFWVSPVFNPPTTPPLLQEWKHHTRSISSVEMSDSWNNRMEMGAFFLSVF